MWNNDEEVSNSALANQGRLPRGGDILPGPAKMQRNLPNKEEKGIPGIRKIMKA